MAAGEVYVVRLVDGTEVLGEYLTETENSLILSWPLKVNYVPVGEGDTNTLSLEIYQTFGLGEMQTFMHQHIIGVDIVSQNLTRYYFLMRQYLYSFVRPRNEEAVKGMADALQEAMTKKQDDAWTKSLEEYKGRMVIPDNQTVQ